MKRAAALAICLFAATPAGTAELKRDDDMRPIIAQMLADPALYANKRVTIYGLVVEREAPSVFMLQDVSQRPLKIIGKRGVQAKVGDQVTVRGMLTKDASGGYVFVARWLVETQVLGGGGCC